MPIHLPPISRRQFLGRSLAAGAGLLLGRNLYADDQPVAAHTWALLSDPHISADRTKIARGVNMTENLQTVMGEVAALKRRPAAMLVNGDCAFNNGLAEDYGVFTELVEPARKAQMPVHLTLGNHDERENILKAVPEAREGQGGVADKLVSIVRSPRANWFLLDSLEFTNKTPGLLGEVQVAWLGKALDANQDKPAIVVAHHTPNLDPGKSESGLKDTQKLFAVMEPRKQVKAFIFGHSHHWDTQQDAGGLHLINLPAVAYVFKEGNPNGWVLASLEPDGLRLELSCLDKSHQAHGTVVNLNWRAS